VDLARLRVLGRALSCVVLRHGRLLDPPIGLDDGTEKAKDRVIVRDVIVMT
jgi:hypothetical protein